MNADERRDKTVMLRYQSGEEIKAGDRVLFNREAAEVEFVVDSGSDAETQWFFQEFGGGVMIDEPKVFGRCFIPAVQLGEQEDLAFVSRADARSKV